KEFLLGVLSSVTLRLCGETFLSVCQVAVGREGLADALGEVGLEVVLLFDLAESLDEALQVRVGSIEVGEDLAVGGVDLLEELRDPRAPLALDHPRLPDGGLAAGLGDLGGQPLKSIAGPGRAREHPDGVVQEDRPELLERPPDEDARAARVAGNLV